MLLIQYIYQYVQPYEIYIMVLYIFSKYTRNIFEPDYLVSVYKQIDIFALF